MTKGDDREALAGDSIKPAEPAMEDVEEGTAQAPKPSPELKASWFSRLLFMCEFGLHLFMRQRMRSLSSKTGLDGLLWGGYRDPLQMSHLYAVNEKFESKGLAEKFEVFWNEIALEASTVRPDDKDQTGNRKRSFALISVLFKMFGRRFLPLGLIKFFADIANACTPLLLQAIITFISDSAKAEKPPMWQGFAYAFALFGLNMFATISISFFFQQAASYGMSVDPSYYDWNNLSQDLAALWSCPAGIQPRKNHKHDFNRYELSLLNPSKVCRSCSVGSGCRILPFDMDFLIILIIMSLLIRTIGPSALAGLALLVAYVPFQAIIIRKLVQLRKANATNTDQRVKLTTEVLQSIRVIKFFAWENSFLNRIIDIRTKELIVVVTANLLRSFVTAAGFAVPALAAALTFMVYYAVDPTLDPIKVFTALALFNQLRNPIMWTPMMISSYADASVAVTRITDLLFSPELDFHPELDPDHSEAISVANGSFYWEGSQPAASDDKSDKASIKEVQDVKPKEDSDEMDDTKSVRSHMTNVSDALAANIAPFVSTESLLGTNKPASEDAVWEENKMGLEKTDKGSVYLEELKKGDEKDSFVKDLSPQASPSYRLAVKDINLSIPKGSLVAIVGTVGSGKTSLLSALVGALKAEGDARVVFSGSVGYVPQQAWIMNSTLKDNILFGLPFNKARYDNAIDVCALRKDLEVLAGGDMAEIGERGINLSGGQKQRVSLARLVYFNSSIVLLDDPLSAVDAHVGKHIFNHCIKGALAGKTRILVTHQLHFVPQCDIVITMKDGCIAESGTYSDLMNAKGEFAQLMQSYGGITKDEDMSEDEKSAQADSDVNEEKAVEASDIKKKDGDAKTGQLIQAEERNTGTLSTSVFVALAIAMGGTGFITLLIVTLALTQVTRVANDLWLVYWTSRSIPGLSGLSYLWIYLGFGLSQAITLLIFSALVAIGGMKAARHLHADALKNILRSPILFFDTNPLGRILNRFSRDQDIVDNTLPDALRLFSITFGTCVATFGLLLYSTSGWFAVGLVPMMGLYYFVQDVYRYSARELKRMDALTRSPLYAHISESIAGLTTIRAYSVIEKFVAKTNGLIDTNNRPYYLQFTAQRWLGMRLEIIGNVLVLVTTIFSAVSRERLSPALMGLALSYVLQVTQLLSLCIRQYTEAEVQLVSIERLHFYATGVETEAAEVVDDCRPPKDWPSEGAIQVQNLSMRYQESLPLVLKNITLDIKSHEKIGVVGRTGSGKSSLMLALFRIVEPHLGSIKIDGVEINALGLKDLRSRISIIPQDPLLFSGTIRSNLDPFGEFLDADLWDALERSGMKEAVVKMENGIEASVHAGGENLSVGQRQLLCLARAMVRKPRLVVLDECTANVDLETDHQIQQSLRENLKGATILTIAHRLNTVIDYDRILVLDQGEVAEFDSPANLLEKDGRDGGVQSVFSKLVEETGAANAAKLRELAERRG
ncbi:hypothetical protein HDU67_000804 [Dinochytrium kinnereticum]|nr:hypothetical protein HDU67_000804 [Dinochytrium kinnereticum]